MRDHTDLDRQASRHHGLLTRQWLRDAGVAARSIDRWVASGKLTRVRRGVYRLCGAAPSWEAELMAAQLAAGSGAVASHRSALRLWGMRDVHDELELSVPRGRLVDVPGAIVHRSVDLVRVTTTVVEGVPVTTPVRTLIDAGLLFPEREVQRLTEHAIATDLVTPRDLWQMRIHLGRQGRNGVGVMHRVLTALPKDALKTESGKEIATMRLLRDAGLPAPVPQLPIIVAGHRFRPDLVYAQERVALEYDGFLVHTTPEQFELDRWRRNLMRDAGWTVIEVTKGMLADSSYLLATLVRRALAPRSF